MLFSNIANKLSENIFFTQANYEFFSHKGSFSAKVVSQSDISPKEYPIQKINQSNSAITITFSKSKTATYTKIILPAKKDEILFGGGEQSSVLNLKGHTIPIVSQEQGIGRGNDITSAVFSVAGVAGNTYSSYLPLPIFTSSLGYSFVVDTECYVLMSFKTNKTIIEVYGVPKKIILEATTFPLLSKKIRNKYIPKKTTVPDWITGGMHLGIQGGSRKISKIVHRFQQKNISLSSIWIQDWCGVDYNLISKNVAWKWCDDKKLYPNLTKMISSYSKQGIRVLGYVNPFLHPSSPHFKKAKKQGFLITDKSGNVRIFSPVIKKVAMIDLTNPSAFTWFKKLIITQMVQKGFSGWMADFGEHMSENLEYFDSKISKNEIHTHYISLWNTLQSEIQQEYPDLFIFMRTASIGSLRKCNYYWTGDQFHDLHKEDGLPAAVLSMISLSMLGIQNIHFDCGGFTTLPWKRRTKTLQKRWLETAIFSPQMRSHEGSFPTLNCQLYDSNFVSYTQKMLAIRQQLNPYINKSQRSTRPLVQLAPFTYQDKKQFLSEYKYQYLFGPDILVCPPTKKRYSYFLSPIKRGHWIHIWTGKHYAPGQYSSSSNEPVPVFYTSSSEFAHELQKIKLLFSAV